MKHVLIGRLGKNDKDVVPVAQDELPTDFAFLDKNGLPGHGTAKALADLGKWGLVPSEPAVELFFLAVLVYAADTRINRRSESQDSWTREIRLVLPVHEPEAWSACAPILRQLLDFLTGDKWSTDFRPLPEGFKMPSPDPVADSDRAFSGVSLLSGGMDSLIGALDELSNGSCPLFVSHAGDGATSKAQEACVEGLRSSYPSTEFGHFRFWLQIENGLIPNVRSENTTRSRSFLFIAAAILAGSGMGTRPHLRAPENGLIALNVPLDPNRVGSLSTRTTHPFYFARWQDLLDGIGIPASIENPYWSLTKGEMVQQCRDLTTLVSLLPASMSCSSPAKGRWLGTGPQHCGYCLPCIIRRAAILKGFGGSIPDPTVYTLANLSGVLDTRKSEGKQARSFQVAIDRVVSKPSLADFLILKTGPLIDVEENRAQLSDVYLRGMLEVAAVLQGVVTVPL